MTTETRLQGDVFVRSTAAAGVVEFDIALGVATFASVGSGIVDMAQGFDTAVALSLFGGNFSDDGSAGNPETYWGNVFEDDPARKEISRTQNLLRSLPATSANLRLIEAAVRLDLAWFVSKRIADEVIVSASIPDAGRIQISGSVSADGVVSNFTFTENWTAAK